MSSTNNDSEDDDPRVHSSGMSSTGGQPRRYELSKSELRKNNKPIMEKKRRARINQCLDELKTLILDALKKDPARHSKLEKADILEMTVRHLQSIHRGGGQPPAGPATEPSASSSTAGLTAAAVVQKFQTGYQECAGEVSRFVGRLDGVDDDIKKRLTSHLDSCVAKMSYIAATTGTVPPPQPPPPPLCLNNYASQLQQRLDLTAAASSLLPNSSRLQLLHAAAAAAGCSVGDPSSALVHLSSVPLPPQPLGRVRTSAFTTVHVPSAAETTDRRTPYVYCDEPAVSSTSSWAEDAAVLKEPPLDFSIKKSSAADKRPLGDISVNVPTATIGASSSSYKTAAASSGSGGQTSSAQLPGATAARPCEAPAGSDPNMWRPW